MWYSYDGRRDALAGVSLDLKPGGLALLGPNGSGKTTLLKVLGLIYRPGRGKVYVNGIDYWSSRRSVQLRLRRRVVYVHETPVLLRGTVLYNVAYGLRLRGVGEDEARSTAMEWLERLGISHLAGKRGGLSAGEAQMVAMARALALAPAVLLLDEPLSNLDFEKRRIALRVLREYAERGTVVVATHDHLAAATLATTAAILEGGRIRSMGSVEELLGVKVDLGAR